MLELERGKSLGSNPCVLLRRLSPFSRAVIRHASIMYGDKNPYTGKHTTLSPSVLKDERRHGLPH